MDKMWDIGRSTHEKLRQEWEEEGVLEEKIEEHRDKFEDRFEDALEADISPHPYKVYRNIVEEQEITEEERLVLEELKDEYAEKWKEQKKQEREN